MTMPDRLYATPPAADGLDSQSQPTGPDHDVLMELRKDLAAVVAELTTVVERRAAEAEVMAGRAIEGTSQIIRLHPVAAVAIAMLVGAGIAQIVVPSRRPAHSSMHLPAWTAPAMPAAWMQSARDFPASVARSSAFASLASILERVVEQISTLDPKSQLSPALDKAGHWLNGLRGTVGAK
jgi:ElaB/YqjD/DUF883 family membrane-anchored ribosome-binding protein